MASAVHYCTGPSVEARDDPGSLYKDTQEGHSFEDCTPRERTFQRGRLRLRIAKFWNPIIRKGHREARLPHIDHRVDAMASDPTATGAFFPLPGAIGAPPPLSDTSARLADIRYHTRKKALLGTTRDSAPRMSRIDRTWRKTLSAVVNADGARLAEYVAKYAPLARMRGDPTWRAGRIVEPPTAALLRLSVLRSITNDAECAQLWLIASGAIPASLGTATREQISDVLAKMAPKLTLRDFRASETLRRALGAITDDPDKVIESLYHDIFNSLIFLRHILTSDVSDFLYEMMALANAANDSVNFWANQALITQSCTFSVLVTVCMVDSYEALLSEYNSGASLLNALARTCTPLILHYANMWHQSRNSPMDALRRIASHDLGAGMIGPKYDELRNLAPDELSDTTVTLSYAPLALITPTSNDGAADGPIYRWILRLAEASHTGEHAAVFAELPAIVYGTSPSSVELRKILLDTDGGRAIALFVYNAAAAVRACYVGREMDNVEREFYEALKRRFEN